ncbi:peptidase [Ectothiorhodospiraceae bacterium BW-2]|nr:peptidase [Ectothiorhodospiraceae bacterium BW-2]
MFKKIVPISTEQHKKTKIKQLVNYKFAKGLNLATVMVNELPQAATTYPVVLIQAGEQYRLATIFGLEQEQNLFLDEQGVWNAPYIPAILRRYPFSLAQTEISAEGQNYAICLDEESELVNESEGQPLFDNEGQESPLLENVRKFLTELHQMEQLTLQFCKTLQELELIRPLNLQFKQGTQNRNLTGLYAVNEEALNTLSDEQFLTLRKQRALGLIYAHLNSLSLFNHLTRLYQLRQPQRSA